METRKYKTCSKCGKRKSVSKFMVGRLQCKECFYAMHREYVKKHPEKAREYRRRSYWKNPEKERMRRREKYRRRREYEIAKAVEYHQKRYYTDIKYRVSKSMSRRIRECLARSKNRKNKPTKDILKERCGYTIEELMNHLEKMFYDNATTKEKMTWDNYGKRWHIDHIIPISHFKFASMDDPEFKKCWSLSNLQPLWAEENIKKSNRLDWKAGNREGVGCSH